MNEIKSQRIYQYQTLPKGISKSKMEYCPCGVYMYAKSIRDGIARCKVMFIYEQPEGHKFKEKAWIYIPTSDLREPDLYPAYTHQPNRWLRLVNKPVLDAAIEILEENNPEVAEVVANVVTAVKKNEIKVGQIWTTPTKTFTIEKQWDQYFIVKDKHGDRQKYTREELVKLLDTAKLQKSFNKDSILKALVYLLSPYMGAFALTSLISVVKNIIKDK